MGAIDYWCNAFTPSAIDRCWHQTPEIAEIVRWWGLEDILVGRAPEEFLALLEAADVDCVLIPAMRMASHETAQLLWDIAEEEVQDLVQGAAGRIRGMAGINPREGMEGVRRLERWVVDEGFVAGHLHPYGFGLPVNHRRYYPYYAKCAELGVPVVVQIGHSAERMPSALAAPLLVDDIALDFPELKVVAAHTGWPWVEELIALAWKHPNVYIGTSAHHPRYWSPDLVRFADTRGRGKVLFGTDWPVLDHAEALAAIDELDLRDDARALLLGDASKEVFGL